MRWFQEPSRWLAAILLLSICSQSVVAEDPPGQEDLDAATTLKLRASSMADLERVIDLSESAIKKGLDESNEALATSLLTATLFQHGSRFAQALFDPRERNERPTMLKQFALKDLYKIVEYDDSLPQVYMLIARLEGVNVTQENSKEARQKGIAAAEKAIELLEDDKATQSKAFLLRAGYEPADAETRIGFLDQAIEADPTNTGAWRLRGKSRLVQGEMLAANGKLKEAQDIRSQAVQDFLKLLDENPSDADALQSGAELLGRLGKYDEAMEFADQVIEENPRVYTVYLLRARLHHKQGHHDQAITDLNRAVDLKPGNFLAYLDRAEVYLDSGSLEIAAKDYGKARDLQGAKLPQITIQRMMVRSQKDVDKGIEEIKKFLELDEANAQERGRDPDPEYRLQLSATYMDLTKPVETIDVLTPLIELRGNRDFSANTRERNAVFLALRSRANSYLSLGKHQEAVDDYKKAHSLIPNDPGLLNNLAWVLATSPNDEVRQPEEAIGFATKACELTNFKAPHILSTLAAAYADSGDFDSAKKYSKQAVEQESAAEDAEQDKEMLKQLQKEFDSYEQKKPWREAQNVLEEKDDSGDADAEGEKSDAEANRESTEDATEESTEIDEAVEEETAASGD